MLNLIISSLYLILPAYLANAAPVIFAKIKNPFTKKPLPLARPIAEKALGSHKTWRGFYAAYLSALLVLVVQYILQKYQLVTSVNLLDYENICLLLYAFLFGVGALTGDLVKSFFKRRLSITPGKPFIPFDQIDFIIGTYLFLLPFYVIPWQNLLVIVVATPILHLLANVIAYNLGLKKVWW